MRLLCIYVGWWRRRMTLMYRSQVDRIKVIGSPFIPGPLPIPILLPIKALPSTSLLTTRHPLPIVNRKPQISLKYSSERTFYFISPFKIYQCVGCGCSYAYIYLLSEGQNEMHPSPTPFDFSRFLISCWNFF